MGALDNSRLVGTYNDEQSADAAALHARDASFESLKQTDEWGKYGVVVIQPTGRSDYWVVQGTVQPVTIPTGGCDPDGDPTCGEKQTVSGSS
jgi:hypothetical protein